MTSLLVCMFVGCTVGWLIARCEHEWKKKQLKENEDRSGDEQ